jgi:hypothetical protein
VSTSPAPEITTPPNLSPRAAALNALIQGDSASDYGPLPSRQGPKSEGLDGLVSSADATSRERLEHAAEEAIWFLLKPWEMRLHDGRYWYIGRGFDAAILSDGTVEYHAKDGVTLSFVPIMERKGLQTEGEPDAFGRPGIVGSPIPGFGIGIADPGSVLSRAVTGQEPHMLERREFLQKTEALREQLTNLALERERVSADLLLADTLRRLWHSSGVPLSKAQLATFEIWDACAADPVGDAARQRIATFLRELQLERGECPFSQALVQGFNQRHKGPAAFAPCAAPAE